MVDFSISGVEPSGSASIQLISILYLQTGKSMEIPDLKQHNFLSQG
jgi:hypothetical protein